MRTSPDCLPCLLQQALSTVRRCSNDAALHQQVMRQAMRLCSRIDFNRSPPENAVDLYAMVAELTGCRDPFRQCKQESNRLALRLQPELRQTIGAADDPLATAIHFAVAANIIDYGSQHAFDAEAFITACRRHPFSINHSQQLRADLETAVNILYLADNCGELIFDALVIELLTIQGKGVTLAVKERPVINDATLADAQGCGLDQQCPVISNGTGCPGTPLADCSESFKKVFQQADLIISKGQGNFETLSDTPGPLYFLLTVKCEVVGRHMTRFTANNKPLRGKGEMVLLKGNGC